MLIALDGMDGAGKTTQQEILGAHLRKLGWTVAVRNLGSTPRFKEALERLRTGAWQASPAIRELVYYFEGLFAALESARTDSGCDAVIVDRYFLTYRVYGQLNGWALDDISFFTKHLPPPDIYVVLDLPPEVAAARILKARGFHPPELGYEVVSPDAEKARFLEYQSKVRELFLQEAKDVATIIDAQRPEREISDRIGELVLARRN